MSAIIEEPVQTKPIEKSIQCSLKENTVKKAGAIYAEITFSKSEEDSRINFPIALWIDFSFSLPK